MHTTNIIFTDYQTVIGLDNTVYKTQDFFNLVETRIRSGEIINCDYDIRNKKLTFMYDYEKYQINISDDEKESYTNSIPLKKIYILMTLFELEKEIRIQREKERQDEFKKEELLNKAKSGKIDSKEVRDLYIKSLKEDKKNNIKGIFKPNYHYKKLPCPNIYDFLLTIAMLLLAIVALPILKSSVIFVISLVTAISNVIALGCGFSMVDKIFFSFKNYIKSIFKKNRLIDYKIMNLEKTLLPSINELKEKVSVSPIDKEISYKIKHLTELLLSRNNKESNDIRREFSSSIKEYADSLTSLSKSGLTLETENSIKFKYLLYLEELENRLNYKTNELLDYKNKLDNQANDIEYQSKEKENTMVLKLR